MKSTYFVLNYQNCQYVRYVEYVNQMDVSCPTA